MSGRTPPVGALQLRYSTVVLDKTGEDAVQINRLEIMFLDKASDLVFKVTDLDSVSLIAGVDGADETHNDGS